MNGALEVPRLTGSVALANLLEEECLRHRTGTPSASARRIGTAATTVGCGDSSCVRVVCSTAVDGIGITGTAPHDSGTAFGTPTPTLPDIPRNPIIHGAIGRDSAHSWVSSGVCC